MSNHLVAADLKVRLGVRQVLDGVSVAFEPGCVNVIIGPNGAGKSTLLACLAGLRRPDAGGVTLNGASVTAIPLRQRAQRLALLPQQTEIAWPIDVRTLVGLGRIPHQGPFGARAEDHAAVDRALLATGLEDMAARKAPTLSGGERSRALIARALAGAPDWILADEPMTGLDPRHALDAADLFRRLAGEGMGVILTLHDLNLAARMADRVVVIREGQVMADGAAGDVVNPDVINRVYGIDFAHLGPIPEVATGSATGLPHN